MYDNCVSIFFLLCVNNSEYSKNFLFFLFFYAALISAYIVPMI